MEWVRAISIITELQTFQSRVKSLSVCASPAPSFKREVLTSMIHLISFEKKFIKAILRWLFPSKCQTGRYVLSKKTFNILAVKWHNADVFSSSFSKDCREAGKGWGLPSSSWHRSVEPRDFDVDISALWLWLDICRYI